jgi:hypothetical protein
MPPSTGTVGKDELNRRKNSKEIPVGTGLLDLATLQCYFIIRNERAECAAVVCIDRLIYVLG